MEQLFGHLRHVANQVVLLERPGSRGNGSPAKLGILLLEHPVERDRNNGSLSRDRLLFDSFHWVAHGILPGHWLQPALLRFQVFEESLLLVGGKGRPVKMTPI